jgi:hypothetical protein
VNAKEEHLLGVKDCVMPVVVDCIDVIAAGRKQTMRSLESQVERNNRARHCTFTNRGLSDALEVLYNHLHNLTMVGSPLVIVSFAPRWLEPLYKCCEAWSVEMDIAQITKSVHQPPGSPATRRNSSVPPHNPVHLVERLAFLLVD